MSVLDRILSHDHPRSRWLAAVLVVVFVVLALAPFLFPGAKSMSVASKILVFVLLVASYDLLLGYTGIVSFAHTMFFGIGAYGIAMASTRLGPTWEALAIGLGASLVLSFGLSLAVGLFSLRVRAIFFAMITLAVAAAFQTFASQMSDFTGGEDGLSFKVPELLMPSHEFLEQPFLGVSVDGRLLTYYGLFVCAVVLMLAMLRIVNSPFGRVLQAIRENEFRAEAIGYRVVVYRTTSSVLSALFATLAGAMLAVWLRYNGPDTSLSFEIMMDELRDYRFYARPPPASRCWRLCSHPTAGCFGSVCCSCCPSTTSRPGWWAGCVHCARPLPEFQPTQEETSAMTTESGTTLSHKRPTGLRTRAAAWAGAIGAALLLSACGDGGNDLRFVRFDGFEGPSGRHSRGRGHRLCNLLLERHPLCESTRGRAALAAAAGTRGMGHAPHHDGFRQCLRAVRPHLRPRQQQQARRNHRNDAEPGRRQRRLPVPQRLASRQQRVEPARHRLPARRQQRLGLHRRPHV